MKASIIWHEKKVEAVVWTDNALAINNMEGKPYSCRERHLSAIASSIKSSYPGWYTLVISWKIFLNVCHLSPKSGFFSFILSQRKQITNYLNENGIRLNVTGNTNKAYCYLHTYSRLGVFVHKSIHYVTQFNHRFSAKHGSCPSK